jgi:hypothetical protein
MSGEVGCSCSAISSYIGYGRIDEYRAKGTGRIPSDRWMIESVGSGRGMVFQPHIATGAAFKAGT